MKSSFLRLEWLSYPAASFRAQFSEHEQDHVVATSVAAVVTFQLQGLHLLELKLSSRDEDVPARYSFEVEAVAGFRFDLESAKAAYQGQPVEKLPTLLATNVARIVYSSARELLATFTARAPHGAAMIESILILPEDIRINSVEPQEVVMRELFGLGDGEGKKPRRGKPAKRIKAD